MNRLLRSALFVLLALCVRPAGAQAAKRPMTLDDIMSIRSLGGIEVAPDGQSVVYTVSGWEHTGDTPVKRTHLWLARVAGGATSGPPRHRADVDLR